MKRTVSHKWTPEFTNQCSRCGLWFEFLHLGASGFQCRMCLELAGENKTSWGLLYGRTR